VDEAFIPAADDRSTGKQAECVFDGDESIDGQPTVATALQTTDVALRGSEHTRQLLLRDPVRAAEQAKTDAEIGGELTALGLTPRNVFDRSPFDG
jgi:hypothetical protein